MINNANNVIIMRNKIIVKEKEWDERHFYINVEGIFYNNYYFYLILNIT